MTIVTMLLAISSGLISSPIEMKNIIMKMSRMGSTSRSIFLWSPDWDTMTPIRNAPMAMDIPMYTDM